MTLNYTAIIVLSIVSIAWGAFWHGPLFGKLWMEIHWGENTPSKKQQEEMMKGMWKQILTEFVASFLMIISIACIINAIPQYNGVQNAFMLWLGFVVPMTVSNVIWGGDKKKWWCKKILVTIGSRLIIFLFAGYILSIWK